MARSGALPRKPTKVSKARPASLMYVSIIYLVFLTDCLSMYLSMYYLPMYLSMYLSIYITNLLMYLSIYLPNYLSSIHLSINWCAYYLFSHSNHFSLPFLFENLGTAMWVSADTLTLINYYTFKYF